MGLPSVCAGSSISPTSSPVALSNARSAGVSTRQSSRVAPSATASWSIRRDLAVAGRHIEPVADLDRDRFMVPRRHARPALSALSGHQRVVRRRPAPGNLEFGEVAAIDLIERCVSLTRVVAGDDPPVGVRRLLSRSHGGCTEGHRQPGAQELCTPATLRFEHPGTVAAAISPRASRGLGGSFPAPHLFCSGG